MRGSTSKGSQLRSSTLARYLNSFLRERRGLTAARVKAFVNPQLGLTDRIAVLLDLTIGERLKGLVNIDDVLVAVRMRNHVVHKRSEEHTSELQSPCNL